MRGVWISGCSANGGVSDPDRLLRSAWEYQRRQEVLSISPKPQAVNSAKAEKSLVRKFFANAFVQAVAVFIALAVAFSGKLDTYGTTVAIVVAWGVGSIGVWTHCSNSRTQKIIALLLIAGFSMVLWAFNGYLTGKSPTSVATTLKKLPDLGWRYDVVLFGYVTDDDTKQKLYAPGGSNIIVAGEISNSGEAASVARSWHLTVRMSGEQEIRQTNMLAPGRTTFQTGPPKEDFLQMSFKDYLPEMTTTQTIASGNNKVGFVVFALKDVTQERMGAAGNTLTLSFEDVNARVYKFDFVTTGAMDKPRLTGQPVQRFGGNSYPADAGASASAPAASRGYERKDSTTHRFMCSHDGEAEVRCDVLYLPFAGAAADAPAVKVPQ